jgi:hypothetical protein
MELLIIVIVALALLAISKGGIEININHTHIHKQDELSVDIPKDEDGEPKYNPSYGDPGVVAWFDQMHSRKGENE